jgi:hypothetical protein
VRIRTRRQATRIAARPSNQAARRLAAVLRQRRQQCAEDVIAAGEKMLTATVSHQAPMIQEASTFLRDLLRQAGDKPVDSVDNSVEEDPNAAPF